MSLKLLLERASARATPDVIWLANVGLEKIWCNQTDTQVTTLRSLTGLLDEQNRWSFGRATCHVGSQDCWWSKASCIWYNELSVKTLKGLRVDFNSQYDSIVHAHDTAESFFTVALLSLCRLLRVLNSCGTWFGYFHKQARRDFFWRFYQAWRWHWCFVLLTFNWAFGWLLLLVDFFLFGRIQKSKNSLKWLGLTQHTCNVFSALVGFCLWDWILVRVISDGRGARLNCALRLLLLAVFWTLWQWLGINTAKSWRMS